MRSYTRGNPIVLKGQVWATDPMTEVSTPANAATAVFTVHHPDDTVSSYAIGDPEVTNPATGVYLLTLPPQLPVGSYRANLVTTDPVTDEWDDFEVLEDGVLPPAPSPVPFPGPCSPWITGDDVALECDTDVGSDTWKLDTVAAAASSLLFSLSGRLFPGVCERTVRPCRDACSCWSRASGVNLAGAAAYPFYWRGSAWGDECGSSCGCGAESSILLPGIPVREVLAVKVDGATLSPTSYRLDGGRRLLRLSDPGPPVVANSWPACQDMTLADDQPGTFSIRYRWGVEPPELGRLAAASLACELWKASTTGKCRLPSNVTRIVRQGITIDRVVAASSALRSGATGLAIVDAFLADVNPNGLTRRPAVFSPDVRRARRSG